MAIYVQNEREAKALAQALMNGEVPSDKHDEVVAALRSYNEDFKARSQQVEGMNPALRAGQLVGQGAAVGIADTADMLLSPITGAMYGIGKLTGLVDEDTEYFDDFMDTSKITERLLGVDPDLMTAGERDLYDIARVVGGTVGGIGAGRSLAVGAGRMGARKLAKAGHFLSTQPVAQTGAAVSGEVLRQYVRDTMDVGPAGELTAALVGGIGFSALAAPAASKALRSLAGYGSEFKEGIELSIKDVQRLNNKLKKVRDLDRTMMKMTDEDIGNDVLFGAMRDELRSGEVTPIKRLLRILPEDTTLGKLFRNIPGASGRYSTMAKDAEIGIARVIDDHAWQLVKTGDAVGLHVDDQVAGEALERGIGAAVQKFKDTAKAQYREANDLLPPKYEGEAFNTARFFHSVDKDAFAKALGSETMTKLKNAFESGGKSLRQWADDFIDLDFLSPEAAAKLRANADKAGDQTLFMDIHDLIALRKAVGGSLANPRLLDDAPRGQLKQLYKAITEDIDVIARNLDNNPLAIGPRRSVAEAFATANATYAAGVKRFDDTLRFITQKIEGKGQSPEQLFQSFVRSSKVADSAIVHLRKEFEGAGRMKDWDIVTSNILRQMGKATDSAQDAAGGLFSMETFLTNWNRMGGRSKAALFPPGSEIRKDLDAAARIAARARDTKSSKGLASSLMTAGAAVAAPSVGGIMAGPMGLVGALGAFAGANTMARMLSHPYGAKFLKFTMTNPSASPAALLAHLQNGAKKYPELAEDIMEFVQAIGVLADANADGEAEDIISRY